MDNEKKETRRAFLSIFISLISIVCFFTCGGAAYSQTGAGFYGNPGNSGSWQRPAPSRPPPARPRPVPRPYRGYWEEVGYQWQGFGLAACEAVHSTGDLAYGGLQIGGYIVGGLAYGVGLVRDPARLVPPNPGSWQSGMMNGFDARCKNGEAGAATAELVINTATCGIVPLIEGAGNDVLTGSNNTMGWLGGQFGGTAVGAGTAPIGGMLWPMVRPSRPPAPTLLRPNIGSKLDYLFGKARGREHNINRTCDMYRVLRELGFEDTPMNRSYIEGIIERLYQEEIARRGWVYDPDVFFNLEHYLHHPCKPTGAKFIVQFCGDAVISFQIKTGQSPWWAQPTK